MTTTPGNTDFALNLDSYGCLRASLDHADPLLNAVLLSLHVRRGSFFLNPSFGSRLHDIKTTSITDVALARQYVEDSLAWLIKAKMADNIDVSVSSERGGKLIIRVTLDTRDPIIVPWGGNAPPPPRIILRLRGSDAKRQQMIDDTTANAITFNATDKTFDGSQVSIEGKFGDYHYVVRCGNTIVADGKFSI